jgi:hypothetical protein
MFINPEVTRTAVFLDVPMIRDIGMSAILDPYPTVFVNESFLPFLRAVPHGFFLDDEVSAPIFHQTRLEGMLSLGRQSGLFDLVYHLLGQIGGQGKHPSSTGILTHIPS